MTKQPYNSDPLDQPPPPRQPVPGEKDFWTQTKVNVINDPSVPTRFNWTAIVHSADEERKERIADLNEFAKDLAIQIQLEENPRVRMVLETKYDILHKQINRIFDELTKRPPGDLLSRRNISYAVLEKIPAK